MKAQKAEKGRNGNGKSDDDEPATARVVHTSNKKIVKLYDTGHAIQGNFAYPTGYDNQGNFACPTPTTLTPTAVIMVTNNTNNWVVDSGASQHFSSFYSDFNTIKRWSTPRLVSLADGSYAEATGSSDISIVTTGSTLYIRDIWYAPSLNCRLVSTIQLNEKGVLVLLADKKLEAYKLSKHQLLAGDLPDPLFTGSVRMNLYYIDQPAAIAATLFANENTRPETSRQLWHRRTAYLGFKYVDQLPHCTTGVELKKERGGDQPAREKACELCLASKIKESFIKKTNQRKTQKLRRIHADISGIKALSIRGYKYFLLVVDNATRYTEIKLLKDKSAAIAVPAFNRIVSKLELKSGNKVVLVRSDNRTREFGALYREQLGTIQTEYSPAHKQSLNRVIKALI